MQSVCKSNEKHNKARNTQPRGKQWSRKSITEICGGLKVCGFSSNFQELNSNWMPHFPFPQCLLMSNTAISVQSLAKTRNSFRNVIGLWDLTAALICSQAMDSMMRDQPNCIFPLGAFSLWMTKAACYCLCTWIWVWMAYLCSRLTSPDIKMNLWKSTWN